MVNIQPFTQQTLSTLLALPERPNLSVYMPTHRTFPERNQDPIRFKNLIKRLEGAVQQQYPQIAQEALLGRFKALVDDHDFWNACPNGIAVFGGLEHFMVVGLQQSVQEVAIVNRHPYLKPLLRLGPMADRYQVLCLSRNSVWMYEGSGQVLQDIQLPEAVPTTQDEALGDQLTPRDQQGHPDGFSGGGEQNEINLDRERFFRIVDRKVTELCSRVSGLPLILVALPENQAVFRSLSHNPLLLACGIDQDPATLTPGTLRSLCGESMRIRHDEKLNQAFDRYGVAVGQQQIWALIRRTSPPRNCDAAMTRVRHLKMPWTALKRVPLGPMAHVPSCMQ
jgi:hypothetical protein